LVINSLDNSLENSEKNKKTKAMSVITFVGQRKQTKNLMHILSLPLNTTSNNFTSKIKN